jgi:hypothetical protein
MVEIATRRPTATIPQPAINKYISNYVCLACCSVRLLQIDDKLNNIRSYQCPNCGKEYYPKMHLMRRDPSTTNSARLQTTAIMQKGILSLDDKRNSSTNTTQTQRQKLNPHVETSPMIRYVSKNEEMADKYKTKQRRFKNIRMTKYMFTEGSYFKQKRIPKELVGLGGAEIVSFKETIE